MKHPISILIVSLTLAQPVIAGSSPGSRLDSLVGTWKNPRPGAESLKVTIRKNQAGELVVQGDDGASSYTLTCRRESGSVACAGPGKMRADGQAFIYRNTIKPAGDKLVENWRVNLASSPDGPPVNSGNDELVRETDSRRKKEPREQKAARVDSAVAPRLAPVPPPPRPNLPFEVSEDVWKVLETSEAYLNHPRQQPLRTRSSYERQFVYTGAKNAALKPPPPKVESKSSETVPISDRCHKAHQTSSSFVMDNYSCGGVHLGRIHDGKPSSVIKSLDQLQGSLFPMRVGARMSYRAQFASLLDSKYDSTSNHSCEVVSKISAQELDSRLTGAAWKMQCQHKTIMPNNDNKVTDRASEDYYLEDMGTQVSMIGEYNQSTKEYVLPKAGTQTVVFTEGDSGIRLTSTYQYHHFAVGESQIAADSTEWVQQNAEVNRKLAEKNRKLAENQRQKTEREQDAAREQQAAQSQPANVAPAQTSQSAGSGLLGALVGEVIKGGLGQAASRNRASGTAGSQFVGEVLGQMATKTGNSSSLADTERNAASITGATGGGSSGGGCCSSVSERIADNRARGAPDDFETHLEMNCRKAMKFDMRINYCQEAVNDRRLNRDGLEKYPHPRTVSSGGSEEARNREIANQCIASSKQNTNQPQIDNLCSQAANYMCLHNHFKDQAPQLKQQAMQVCQSLKTVYGDVCKGPCNEASR